MSIMQEQKMIDESLLLRYFEQEVSEEEKKKVEEWNIVPRPIAVWLSKWRGSL